jgi:SOS-response transcriptional repressor LexA
MSTRDTPGRRKGAAKKLSGRQARILAFIRAFLGALDYPPTVREIGAAVGIGSTSVVEHNLRRLAASGHIRRVTAGSGARSARRGPAGRSRRRRGPAGERPGARRSMRICPYDA